ncbi:MAG TPA: 4-(cytidine 5'-diphospho)-2-C-methyl-D-erythritol kinase [Vicinamibacterales bacterium]|nr:4-(cytidine 5'-diphospho)-2-C-methyl-D-erythritol kinase [Vicinamibacterales bacterium]
MRIVLKAHAKLNLDLRVLGRREDGYHELRTIFQTIALHDTVVIEAMPRQRFSLIGDGSVMPLDGSNLAWKAAAALWKALGRKGKPAGVRLTIRKRIPSQAGLGGGSSDAAATLVGLQKLWRASLRAPDLLSVAATLGADVPFFLVGGTALGLARGDDVYPLIDLPPRDVVIVRPSFGVSTMDAYAWLSASRSPRGRYETDRPSRYGNDFEAVVEEKHPELREIRERLRRFGATVARLSGSGSAVFGVFDTPARAKKAAAALQRRDWIVAQSRTVPRSPRQRDFAAILAERGLGASASHLSPRRRIP